MVGGCTLERVEILKLVLKRLDPALETETRGNCFRVRFRVQLALLRHGLRVKVSSEGAVPVEMQTDVLLINTVGILPQIYAATKGKPVFVGGSLFPGRGLHWPTFQLDPGRFGQRAVLYAVCDES
jgi:hypothetical protein